jgi:uncharacterized protein
MMKANYSPVKISERIVLLDVLRGLAIFGILMVNMPLMYEPMVKILAGANPDATTSQLISESIIKFFFEGKFYVIFSFLFGYGFWLFMNKTTPDGSSIIPVFRRRLIILLIFGIAHVLLLWSGDILVFYALFGFVLILFRRSSGRKILKWSVWLMLIPSLVTAVLMGFIGLVSQNPEAKAAIDANMMQGIREMHQMVVEASLIYSQGSFFEMVMMRLKEYQALLPAIIFFYPVVLGVFLLGLWAARKELLADFSSKLPFFRNLFWWSLGIGLIANSLYIIAFRHAVMSIPSGWSLLATSMHTLGGISLGFFFISALVLIFAKGKCNWLGSMLAPVGRMALTNYLMQSVICAFLFHSYGLGLFGKITTWQGMMLTVLIFSVQVLFSRWWLSRFRFGPLEWLWRSLTYFKRIPMKKTAA